MSELSERQRRNLEATKAGFDAFDRGDIEAVIALADPEVEIYSPQSMGNPGTFHGHDGYLKWLGEWLEAWEDFSTEVTGAEAVGERHVVSTIHQSARGKGSGVIVERDGAFMAEIGKDRYVALHLYPSRDEAVKVAERREAEGSA